MIQKAHVLTKGERMKAKERFMDMFDKLPYEARILLNYGFGIERMSINVLYHEIKNDTKFGKKVLVKLGFENS